MRRDWLLILTVVLVAASTVIASFTAQAGLGVLAGWHASLSVLGVDLHLSWLLPLTVDAYGVGATRIATNKRQYSAEVRRQAFGHALAAVAVSVVANAVFHLLEAKVIVLGNFAWVLVVAVSIVPPVALGGLAHLLSVAARDEVEPAPEPVVVEPVEVVEADQPDRAHVRDLPVDVPALPVPPPAPTTLLTPAPDELFPVAAVRYAEQLAAGEVPPLTRIKKELSVGQPRAARIRTYLGQLAESTSS